MKRVAAVLVVLFACLSISADQTRPPLEDRKSWVGGRTFSGEPLDVDLPGAQHIANIGSQVDGLGMCVMSSIEMAALWAGLEQYRGLRDWCARDSGGAYPEKVDKQLAAFAKAKGLPAPRYIQYEGPSPGAVVEAALKSGRMAALTYGWSPRYPGEPYISHMTNCVKFGGKYGVILDNNYPGEDRYEWMDRDELVRRCKWPGKSGWVFVWLEAPPPPSPRNQ